MASLMTLRPMDSSGVGGAMGADGEGGATVGGVADGGGATPTVEVGVVGDALITPGAGADNL